MTIIIMSYLESQKVLTVLQVQVQLLKVWVGAFWAEAGFRGEATETGR